MNRIDFSQIGGFPLTTTILGKLQESWNMLNAFGALAGEKTIISGCVTTGTNVSDGVVFVNGECFNFIGGIQQTKVIIKEDTEGLIFGNNNTYQVVKTRYVQFGSGVGSMDWADFKRPIETKLTPNDLSTRLELLEKKAAVFQTGGGMVLWNKPAIDIPEGWAEVVNWRGRIPVGLDSTQTEFNAMGKQGGQKNKTLSIDEMPKHSHSVKGYAGLTGIITSSHINAPTTSPSGDATSEKGGSQEFSLMNPYRVVLFIEFIG